MDATVEDVKRLICAHYSDDDEPLNCHVRGPLYRGIASQIFYAETPSIDSPLNIKFCIDPTTGFSSGHDAATQYKALCRANGAMAADDAYGVARPIALFEDEGVVIAEWVEGRSLTACLRDWRNSPAELNGYLARAGGWLRRFHRATSDGEAPIDVDHHLAILEDTLAEAGRDFATTRVVVDALDVLAASAPSVARQPMAKCWLHGDFKPDNLIISPHRTVAIDIHTQFHNPIIHDIAHFTNHIVFATFHPMGLRLLPRIGALSHAFLDAYASDDWSITPRPLAWMRLHNATRKWAEAFSPSTIGLGMTYQSLRFRRVVQTLTGALSTLRD